MTSILNTQSEASVFNFSGSMDHEMGQHYQLAIEADTMIDIVSVT